MTYFYAKTDDAYTVKTTIEVLQNTFTDVCFEFRKDSIHLRTVDNKQPPTLLANLDWHRDKFEIYKCDEKSTQVGVTLPHMYKILKSIKKKDKLSISLSKEQPDKLILNKYCYGIQPSESVVQKQFRQVQDIPIPENYGYPHLVSTSEFQKCCKEINSLSKVIKIYSKGNYIEFSCLIDGLYGHTVPLGEGSLDPDSDEEEYEEYFFAKSINQLVKISGLNTKMHIYTQKGQPLKISVQTGTLGKLDFYLKSKTELESVSNN